MTTFSWHRRSLFVALAASFAVLLSGTSRSSAGDITYSLASPFTSGNGMSDSGSITTDGNTGTLAASDILSWSWSAASNSNQFGTSGSTPAVFSVRQQSWRPDNTVRDHPLAWGNIWLGGLGGGVYGLSLLV